ncbi:myb-related transcription factor, partner of profilin-like [Tachyglossus aculeatus]|uniref:myb-related transcription factor, partner of profilin-like n=1 Tax=Tachyglossus aculeatus TaxID=9261 RepID=UPI0018F55BC0|nr:myb-related transcription factor, partner of profilin-like [Tachyglossus aculeatus]
MAGMAGMAGMAVPGRKRKANFSNDETETLVWNVVRHFGALYGADALRTHAARRNQLWAQIQSRVNFLGYTERSVEDLKHKWRDLRLDVKRKLSSRKGGPGGSGPLKARLTPLEKMVASTFTQASSEAEQEAGFDPDSFFPGASKQLLMPLQPSIFINTNGQPSSLPDVEGGPGPRPAGRSPDPSGHREVARGEGQSSGEPRPQPPTSPPLRNGTGGPYGSAEEEEADARPLPARAPGPGPDPPKEEEEDEDEEEREEDEDEERHGSRTSLPSTPEDGPDWTPGPAAGADHSPGPGPAPAQPADGGGWEKEPGPRSPAAASPGAEPPRTNWHRLLDLEEQWDQLYQQELGVWQEERAQQREERARDRELQARLLGVLTDIRDELRYLRQERAFARRAQAAAAAGPQPPAAQDGAPFSGTSPHPGSFFFQPGSGRGEPAGLGRGGPGVPRRGRGRPRGSTSKHRRLYLANS